MRWALEFIEWFVFILVSSELVGFWPFNENYRGRDLSVHENNATVTDVSQVTGPGPGCNAYKLLGQYPSHFRIKVRDTFTIKNTFTCMFYIYPSGKPGLILNHYGFKKPFVISFNPAWNILLFKSVKGTGYRCSMGNLQVGKWYFVGYSYNHTTTRLISWIDGQQLCEWNMISRNFIKDTDITIGAGVLRGEYWNGSLACLMLYKKELQQSEILSARQQCLETFSK